MTAYDAWLMTAQYIALWIIASMVIDIIRHARGYNDPTRIAVIHMILAMLSFFLVAYFVL